MKIKTLMLFIIVGVIISSGVVFAAVPGPSFDVVGKIFNTISEFFLMKWLDGGNIVGFLRFMIWITVFTIFYSAGQVVFGRMYGDTGKGAANRNAIMIAVILATATTIFTPTSMLRTIFESYTAIVLFVLLAIPIGGIIYIIYPLLGQAIPGGGWGLRIARICGLLLIWWILFSSYGDELLPGTLSFSFLLIGPWLEKLLRSKK